MDDTTQQVLPTESSFFLPHQSYLGWKIVITIFHVFAVASTVYRLIHRRRIRRLWQDDYVIFIALVLDFTHWPLYWARFPIVEGSSESFIRTQQILNSYWLTILPWFIILAWAIVSYQTAQTILIFPPMHPARLWSFILVQFFILNLIGTMLAAALTCKSASRLLVASEMRDCIRLPSGVPLKNIIVFASDAGGDLSLILTPLYFFWRIKLPAQERRLILIFFCGSTLTLLSAIMYLVISTSRSVTSLKKDWSLVNLGLGAIETSMSFLACNSVVITTCLYRALRRFRGLERPELESTLETPRVPPSRECTCVISEHITQITLTDLSGNSYQYEDSESRSDSVTSSQNFQSQRSFSGSEGSSSQYTTSQNSSSQNSRSQSSSSQPSSSQNSHSQGSGSDLDSNSYGSQNTANSLSTFNSYISSNHSTA